MPAHAERLWDIVLAAGEGTLWESVRQTQPERSRMSHSEPADKRLHAQPAPLQQHLGQLEQPLAEQSLAPGQGLAQDRLASSGAATIPFGHKLADALNGMSMLVQLVERRLSKLGVLGVNTDGRLEGYIHTLRHEMQRLNRLVQEFRAFSEPAQLVFRPTNLATLLGEMLTAETPRYLEQGIGVERKFAPHVPQTKVDAEALKQVFFQLCQNAVEAMPEGGTLKVQLYHSDTQIRLEVADTGIGLPAGVPIFEPWVTTKAQGTGLGLALVQHLVAAHAGQVRSHSTPGQGTTFTLILPLTPPGQTGHR